MTIETFITEPEVKAINAVLAIAGKSIEQIIPERRMALTENTAGDMSSMVYRNIYPNGDITIGLHFIPSTVVATIGALGTIAAACMTIKKAAKKIKGMFRRRKWLKEKIVGPWKIIEVRVERGVKE